MDDESLPVADTAPNVLSAVKSVRADVVALATVASLARRIEPELLRTLRLTLADRFEADARPHAATEAGLWFSPLIESRGPDSITLLPEISRQLQDSLATNSELLEAARAVIEECHRDIAPVLRWEEELVYVALTRTLTEGARQRRIREAAREALGAISRSDRPGLEDRVREMWVRLPEPATTNSYLANVHHLCDVRAIRRRGASEESTTGLLESIPLQLSRSGMMWQLGALGDDAEFILRVPAIEPVILEVLKTERSKRAVKTLLIRADQTVEVPVQNRPLVLRTIDGRVYSIDTEGIDRPSVTSSESSAGSTKLNEARVILVGSAGAGKTSLIARLLQDAWRSESATTHAIEISAWQLTLPSSEQVQIHFWDFGGQLIYSGLEELFFGRSAVYLLVLDARHDVDAEMDLWLNRVTAIAGDSPVIVAFSKVDVADPAVLRRSDPRVKELVSVSAKTGEGLDALRDAIARSVATLPTLRTQMPHAWVTARARLSSALRPYLQLSDFRKICAEEGVSDPDNFVAFLHDLGIVLHFDDSRLRDVVVLDMGWVVNAMAGILDAGRRRTPPWEVRQRDLSQALEPSQYPALIHGYLLEVMQRFELCYPLPGGDGYLVPQLLTVEEPQIKPAFQASQCLNFQYAYSVWLGSLMARFIARTHEMSNPELCWGLGTVLTAGDNRALVRADPRRRLVTVSIDGTLETRRTLLELIRSSFQRLHDSLPTLQVRAEVPLPRNPSVTFPYDSLEQRLASGGNTVVDPETDELVDIRMLLGMAPVGSGADLSGADLRRADTIGTDLHEAVNLDDATLAAARGLPANLPPQREKPFLVQIIFSGSNSDREQAMQAERALVGAGFDTDVIDWRTFRESGDGAMSNFFQASPVLWFQGSNAELGRMAIEVEKALSLALPPGTLVHRRTTDLDVPGISWSAPSRRSFQLWIHEPGR